MAEPTDKISEKSVSLSDMFIERVSGDCAANQCSMNNVALVKALYFGVEGRVLRTLSDVMSKRLIMDVVGADIANFSKLTRRKRLSSFQTEALNDLTLLWQELLAFFENDRELLSEWIDTQLQALDSEKPSELMKSQFGRKIIRALLDEMRFV